MFFMYKKEPLETMKRKELAVSGGNLEVRRGALSLDTKRNHFHWALVIICTGKESHICLVYNALPKTKVFTIINVKQTIAIFLPHTAHAFTIFSQSST